MWTVTGLSLSSSSSGRDDVLHLGPVEMHGGVLPLLEVQELFRIRLGVGVLPLEVPVSDRDEGEAHLVEFAEAVVGDVPAEKVVAHLVVFMALCLPFFGREVTEVRQKAAVFPNHLLHLAERRVDFTAFHMVSSLCQSKIDRADGLAELGDGGVG